LPVSGIKFRVYDEREFVSRVSEARRRLGRAEQIAHDRKIDQTIM
jgi:hypothetical protein